MSSDQSPTMKARLYGMPRNVIGVIHLQCNAGHVFTVDAMSCIMEALLEDNTWLPPLCPICNPQEVDA